MLPESWRAVPSDGSIRLGAPHDGGYVVPRRAVEAADALIGMGLFVDWTFEADFRRLRPDAPVSVYDHTVDSKLWTRVTLGHVLHRRFRRVPDYLRYRSFFSTPGVVHHQVAIGYDGPASTSFTSILSRMSAAGSLGLKIDIEGWEYRILDQLAAARDHIGFVVIEFHDVDLQRERIQAFLTSMTGFTITWIHANNFAGTDPHGDPLVLEMCLAADRWVTPCDDPALVLTTPNNPELPEIDLVFG